ncbi:MAG: hypothetical protein II453_02155 [Alphaproteobacteria bacterium]|nr:hypothetical protein [Alphaproteobacteria bacterium]
MTGGWIKIHRSLLDWEWYDNQQVKCVFLHLLLKANFEPKKWHGITVERGQIVTSLELLSIETGLSVQTVRTVISKLKSTGELTSKSTNKFTILTICNYDTYQDENFETNTQTNNQTNKQLTNNQQTTNKQLTTTKEDKEYKEDEELKKKEVVLKEKETKKETTKELDRKFKQALLELGVNEPLTDEWISIRKMKGRRNSEFALKTIVNEANKAGISLQEAVEFSAKRQYSGFMASWYIKELNEQRNNRGGGRGHTLEEMARIVDAGIALNDILGTRNEKERRGETWNSTGR